MPPHGLCSVNSHRCCSPGFAEVRAVEQEPDHKNLGADSASRQSAGALEVGSEGQRAACGSTGEHAQEVNLARRCAGRGRRNCLVLSGCQKIRADCGSGGKSRGGTRRQRRCAVERECCTHARHVRNCHRRRTCGLCCRGVRHCLRSGVGSRELRCTRGLAVHLQIAGVRLARGGRQARRRRIAQRDRASQRQNTGLAVGKDVALSVDDPSTQR